MADDYFKKLRLGAAMCAVLTAAFAPMGIALADSPPAPAATQTPQDFGGLAPIIVTARKHAENAQDVPVAVQVISGREIRSQHITSLQKVAGMMPDFIIGQASNGSAAQLTMRGIGSSSTSIGIEQSVAVDVDGVYYGQGRVLEEGFFDLSRIQLLKGPQALFFGKNATAGVVAITTADPTRKTEFIGDVNYEFESRQTQASLIGSGMLTDTLGLRVAVRGSVMNGGYYHNVSVGQTYTTLDVANNFAASSHYAPPTASQEPGKREFLSRVTLKWTPNDALTGRLKLSSDSNYLNNSSFNYMNFNCANGVSTLGPPHYPCGFGFVTHQNDIPTDIAANFPYAQNNGALYNQYDSYATTGTLNYTGSGYTLASVSNYQTNTDNWACACDFQSSPTGTWATEHSVWTAASEELRLRSTSKGPINFMLGAYAQKTRRWFEQWVMFAGLNNSAASAADNFLATSKNSATDGKTFSLFGQAIWDITPTVEATAGARWTHETKSSFFVQPYNNPALTSIFRPANVPMGIVNADQTFNNVSPEVTLSWKPSRDVMVYGAYKTAFKSGGFDNGGINSAFMAANPATYMTFAPEKARGFEVGVKSTVLDNQLRANVTAFDYKYTDMQVDFFNSATFAFQTVSAAAETKGVEVELDYAPRSVPGLSLHSDLNYDDAKYTNFIGPCYSGETPSAGCNIPTATVPFQNLTGTQLGLAPKVTGTVGGRYEWSVSSKGARFGVTLDARYSGKYYASSFGNPASKVGSYTNIDASLRWTSWDDKYEFSLLGSNLTNLAYVNGVVDGPSTGGGTGTAAGVQADQLGFGNIPRTIMFTAQVKFY